MERQIGATSLRQQLTDVIHEIKEEGVTYVVETFGRPQVAIVDLAQYRHFQQYREQRRAMFQELMDAAAINAQQNAHLTEADILALIETAREEVWQENQASTGETG